MKSRWSGDTMSLAAGLYDITNETLGKGHFAVVKLARHCLSSELVAVKIVDKTKLTAESLQQHNLEVKLLSRLSEHEHPNIVRLYQVINTKSKLYLVMEYCGRDVCDLYDYIQKRNGGSGLKESEAKYIFRQICSAISYCHSLRIVHRDLKPENLLIVNQASNEEAEQQNKNNNNGVEAGLPEASSPPASDLLLTSHDPLPADGKTTAESSASPTGSKNSTRPMPGYKYPIVKLIDFGFANQWQDGVKLRTSCGSLAYSAPEILLGGQYDGDKVDIWGLGCILYILLYGCNPFMQMNDNETLVRIIDCSFKTPDRVTISATAIRLIRSLLVKDPPQRLTMAQLMSDAWFEGMESDPVCQAPSSGTTISSASSHSPTPPSSPPPPPPPLQQPLSVTHASPSPQLQSRGPSRDPAAGESKENISPVLLPGSSLFTSVTMRSKSPSTVNEVHDRVIREMIAHKKELTKERVERALRLSRRPGSSLPAVVESTPLVLEPASVKPANVRIDDDDSYITATYNLLKDKILKELQGIPISSSNTHEISKTHHKKGHALPVRKRGAGVSQAPRFGRPGSGRPLDDLSLKKQLLEEQESSQVVSEEEQDFRLPLQRKCSIVSEEGSCELSGRLSETGSDVQVHTILLGDGLEPITQRRSVPVVDIVITDHDLSDSGNEEATDLVAETESHRTHQKEADDAAEDLSEEIDLRTCTEDRFEEGEDEEEEDFDAETSKERDISPDVVRRMAQTSVSSTTPAKIKNLLETSSRSERLHVVSSSPDLSKMLDEEDENRLDFVTDVIHRSDAAAHITGKRPVTMFIDETTSVKGQVIDDVADHVNRQQRRRDSGRPLDSSAGSSADPTGEGRSSGAIVSAGGSADKSAATTTATPSTTITSVRVITQSKSCNNIIYNEKDRDGENNVQRKGSGRPGSGSSEGSKNRDKNRTDCCLIA